MRQASCPPRFLANQFPSPILADHGTRHTADSCFHPLCHRSANSPCAALRETAAASSARPPAHADRRCSIPAAPADRTRGDRRHTWPPSRSNVHIHGVPPGPLVPKSRPRRDNLSSCMTASRRNSPAAAAHPPTVQPLPPAMQKRPSRRTRASRAANVVRSSPWSCANSSGARHKSQTRNKSYNRAQRSADIIAIC